MFIFVNMNSMCVSWTANSIHYCPQYIALSVTAKCICFEHSIICHWCVLLLTLIYNTEFLSQSVIIIHCYSPHHSITVMNNIIDTVDRITSWILTIINVHVSHFCTLIANIHVVVIVLNGNGDMKYTLTEEYVQIKLEIKEKS